MKFIDFCVILFHRKPVSPVCGARSVTPGIFGHRVELLLHRNVAVLKKWIFTAAQLPSPRPPVDSNEEERKPSGLSRGYPEESV